MYFQLNYTFVFRFLLFFITAQIFSYRGTVNGLNEPEMSQAEIEKGLAELRMQMNGIAARSSEENVTTKDTGMGAGLGTNTEKVPEPGFGEGGMGGEIGTGSTVGTTGGKGTGTGLYPEGYGKLLLMPLILYEGIRLLRALF